MQAGPAFYLQISRENGQTSVYTAIAKCKYPDPRDGGVKHESQPAPAIRYIREEEPAGPDPESIALPIINGEKITAKI